MDKRKTGGLLMITGAGGLIVGSLLPWITASAPFIGTVNYAGTVGDGKITLALGVVGLVSALVYYSNQPETALWLAGLTGIAGAGVGLYDTSNITDKLGEVTATSGGLLTASVGIGLWLTIAAGAVLFIGMSMAMTASRTHESRPRPV